MSNPKLLLATEVAEVLRVSASTVNQMCREKRIRAVKVLSAWRIPQDALDDYLSTGEDEPTAPAKAKRSRAAS